jgi:hypothetical protein
MSPRPPAPRVTVPHRTVVWIDARGATLVRWDGVRPSLRHLDSDIPARHRSTGHVPHAPTVHHGGAGPGHAAEARRLDREARFLRGVADRIDPADELQIIGPGTVRQRLASVIAADDAAHHRERHVEVTPAEPMTDAQLRARLRTLAGVPVRRTGRALP